MDCKEARTLLDAFADGELDLRANIDLQEHLRSCSECARSLDGVRDVKRALKAVGYYRAPTALEAEVASKFGAKRRIGWSLVAWAACVLLAGLIGWSVGRNAPGGSDVLTGQLLSSHLRALTAGHLADVISSDKHTVKPWFNGKIDYSPPVNDFKPEGFPLLGGRLEVLNGRRVAALAYGRAKHIISLYVVPAGLLDAASPPADEDGFNFRHWRESGFDYWAISDLNPQELVQFESLERTAR